MHSNSFTELGGKVADVAKRTDDLKDIRIGGAAMIPSSSSTMDWKLRMLVNANRFKGNGVNTEKLDQVHPILLKLLIKRRWGSIRLLQQLTNQHPSQHP